MSRNRGLILAFAVAVLWAEQAGAGCGRPESASPSRWYDMGQPVVAELYVSPTGNDSNPGTSRGAPLRTLSAAWAKMTDFASTGYRVNFLPGTYPCEGNCINYFADRAGTFEHPVILRAADGAGTVTLLGGLNLNRVAYLYLQDLTLWAGRDAGASFGNNVLHLERGHHVVLRNLRIRGPDCASDACNDMQEDLKVNQAQYLFVEGCDISGAWHTCVDYFAVQYGHVLDTKVHIAGQWGMYVKGGSAYLRVENDEFYDTLLGLSVGQAANLAMMQTPWLHYEAYDVKVANNLFHDLPGIGVAVAGGYNVLVAQNTFYRVATDTANGYGLAHFVRGERNCTPTDDLPDPVPVCGAATALGGWGPDFQTESVAVIPNRNVTVGNNLFYNPMPDHSLYFHLGVDAGITVPPGFPNVPSPSLTDDRLVIRGNVIWNGPGEGLPIVGSAYGGDPGCQALNPDCNETQLATQNTINGVEPQLVNPAAGDYRVPATNGVYGMGTLDLDPFAWDDAPSSPAVPPGNPENRILVDRSGEPRAYYLTPGAYGGPSVYCLPLTTPYTFPMAGVTPLPVLFFADAAIASLCTGTPTYQWTFGDGATSSEVNPRHVYTTPGSYYWTLRVTVDGVIANGGGYLEITQEQCTLACGASVPSTGSAGAPVAFSGTASPSAPCQGAVTYEWNFGDGSPHSTLQAPTHTYASGGSYTWTMTATVGTTHCSVSRAISITTAPPPAITLIKKVAPPFKIVVTGSNLQQGIRVFIDGTEWANVVWKKTTKIQLTGGASLKAAVPRGTTHTFRFVNPDEGEASQPWGW